MTDPETNFLCHRYDQSSAVSASGWASGRLNIDRKNTISVVIPIRSAGLPGIMWATVNWLNLYPLATSVPFHCAVCAWITSVRRKSASHIVLSAYNPATALLLLQHLATTVLPNHLLSPFTALRIDFLKLGDDLHQDVPCSPVAAGKPPRGPPIWNPAHRWAIRRKH